MKPRLALVVALAGLPISSVTCMAQGAPDASPDAGTAGADALSDLRDKADSGDAAAQCSLGAKYWNGDGVPKDPAKAREWFAKAAAHGDAAAQRALDHLQN